MLTRVAVTGGIAAGKSTVCHHLKSLGAFVIDYDILARIVVEPQSQGLEEVIDLFGPQVLNSDGTMNRQWVSQQIFSHPELRKKLNDIIHPLVFAAAGHQEMEWLEKQSVNAHNRVITVHDIPLLVESGRAQWFDVVIDVETPARVRMHRLMADRGMDIALAAEIIDAQSSKQEREAIASYIIDGNQPIEHMFEQLDKIYKDLRNQ